MHKRLVFQAQTLHSERIDVFNSSEGDEKCCSYDLKMDLHILFSRIRIREELNPDPDHIIRIQVTSVSEAVFNIFQEISLVTADIIFKTIKYACPKFNPIYLLTCH